MSELARMATEYFRLGGYQITREASDFVEAEAAGPEVSPSRVLVWADDTLLSESPALAAKSGLSAKRGNGPGFRHLPNA